MAEEEAQKREAYMRAQRDRLVAAKKKEREAKVAAENERLGRTQPKPSEVGFILRFDFCVIPCQAS